MPPEHPYAYFHFPIEVVPGGSLWSIATTVGHRTHAPIIRSPLNATRFTNRSPDLIHSGEVVHVPWTQDQLCRYLAVLRESRSELQATLREIEQERRLEHAQIDQLLARVDLVGFVVSIPVGLSQLAVQAMKMPASASKMLIELLKQQGLMKYGLTSMVLGKPRGVQTDAAWMIRKAFGFLDPSTYVAIFAGVWEGDLQIALHGSNAVEANVQRLLDTTLRPRIRRLEELIRVGEQMLHDPLYHAVAAPCPPLAR